MTGAACTHARQDALIDPFGWDCFKRVTGWVCIDCGALMDPDDPNRPLVTIGDDA